MKTLLTTLFMSLSLAGCMLDEPVYSTPAYSSSTSTLTGDVEFCDVYGCRWLSNATYYYLNGEVVYWDAGLGVWVGPRGYWRGGMYYSGAVSGYHAWYGSHYTPHYYGGYHGGFHVGGGFHGGHHR